MIQKLVDHFRELKITNNQLDVLLKVYSGLSYKQIAISRYTGESAIKFHANNAFKKIGIHSKAEFHAYCNKLLYPDDFSRLLFYIESNK